MRQQVHEGSHRDACRPLRKVRLFLISPASAGDVEMNPWRVARKLADKHGAGNRAAVSPAGVGQVRHQALVQLAVAP